MKNTRMLLQIKQISRRKKISAVYTKCKHLPWDFPQMAQSIRTYLGGKISLLGLQYSLYNQCLRTCCTEKVPSTPPNFLCKKRKMAANQGNWNIDCYMWRQRRRSQSVFQQRAPTHYANCIYIYLDRDYKNIHSI